MAGLTMLPRPVVPDDLEQPEVALAQDGVFTRSQARRAGWSDSRQRRLVRLGLWRALTPRLLVHHEVEVGPWQRARAVHLAGALVGSHLTAAGIWGFVAADALHGTADHPVAAPGVRVHRVALAPGDTVTVDGLRVTGPLRTIADLLCNTPELDAVATLTEAMSRGLLRGADVELAARRSRGRTGAPRARMVADGLRDEPHSVLEYLFHQRLRALGPGWRFHVQLHDERGIIGVVDAYHEPTGVVVELDGRTFHGADQFQRDRTRDQRIAAIGCIVLRFTWADLTTRPLEVVERIRRTMAARRPVARTA
jgi:very-short-patch-repair endonuclease